MDFLHIIGTLFDDSINHIVALAKQVYDENWTKSGENGDNLLNINQYLLNLIKGVEEKSEHSKGFYSSLADLQSKVPEPVVGDWGVIEISVDGTTKLIICRCSTEGTWTQTQEEISLEVPLGEYIKTNKLKTINNLSLIIGDDGETNINTEKGLDYPIVSTDEDGIVSSNLYLEWINIKTEILPKLREDIDDLYLLINSSPEEIQEIINKYNLIKLFVDSLNPDEGVLLEIIERLSGIENEIEKIKENKESGGIKHIVLTKREYNKLNSYEEDTLYIITENESNAWELGDELPIILSSDPNETWVFDSKFPIIFT